MDTKTLPTVNMAAALATLVWGLVLLVVARGVIWLSAGFPAFLSPKPNPGLDQASWDYFIGLLVATLIVGVWARGAAKTTVDKQKKWLSAGVITLGMIVCIPFTLGVLFFVYFIASWH